jgi:integrase
MAYRDATRFEGVYERKLTKKRDVCYDICYRSNGVLKWEKVGKKSEGYSAKLANIVRQERIRSMRHGEELPVKKDIPTFGTLADAFLKWAHENKGAVKADESRYLIHLKPAFATKRIDQITPTDIERLKSKLNLAGLSPKTLHHVIALARVIVNRCAQLALYSGPNPFSNVELPTLNNARTRFLDADEIRILLSTLKLSEMATCHDLALLALHTGCRLSEALDLKAGHIDFSAGFVTYTDTKNRDTRHVPLTGQAREMLERRCNNTRGPEDFVFKSFRGERINHIDNAFTTVCDE